MSIQFLLESKNNYCACILYQSLIRRNKHLNSFIYKLITIFARYLFSLPLKSYNERLFFIDI